LTNKSIILVGGPDTGKTNYLARLWKALQTKNNLLSAKEMPKNLKFVEDALSHLLQGKFAPRSDKNQEYSPSFVVNVTTDVTDSELVTKIIVPDVTGELWRNAVENCELPKEWMSSLRASSGAILFVRVDSELNYSSIDWVTASDFLKLSVGDEATDKNTPTQVVLCELIRFLEHSLGADLPNTKPKVAILVTAWDRLDAATAASGPANYIKSEYPLFAGRLKDISTMDIKIFGVSVVGGDFVDGDFKASFLDSDLNSNGYVIEDVNGIQHTHADLTIPVAWII
jgi:Double-GTPase 1